MLDSEGVAQLAGRLLAARLQRPCQNVQEGILIGIDDTWGIVKMTDTGGDIRLVDGDGEGATFELEIPC